ncbi:MAG TPA: hypothetical protein VFW90_03330 [Candidatus Saccharimonadales bacterium]|nr:hypothetical protein [Candidatus Saccharimonadales bacterium]
MNLIDDDSDATAEGEEKKTAKPNRQTASARPSTPVRSSIRQTAPRWLAGLIVLILIAGIIVGLIFAARAIYHHAHNNNPSNSSVNTTNKPSKRPNGQANNHSKNSKSTNTPEPNNNSHSGSNTGQAATQVPNTGPGSVVAIFVGASLATAGLHYVISLRRFGRSS